MADRSQILDSLVELSRHIGDPARGCVIYGEGNTSAKIDDHRFYVKASGVFMCEAAAADFVEISTDAAIQIAEAGTLADAEIERRLDLAKMDRSCPVRPSVETILHAIILREGGAAFVAHTHPTAVNSILCSKQAEELLSGWLLPEHAIFLGPEAPFVPFYEPGLPLAAAVRDAIRGHRERHGFPPKSLLLQNHGLIVGAQTAAEVEAMTAMWVKASEILLGTLAAGGPRFLPDDAVEHILARADIRYHRDKAT
jgi:rhamnose utilization protein RhaD (predicted bifunctional aldolase and dehydrogenase)